MRPNGGVRVEGAGLGADKVAQQVGGSVDEATIWPSWCWL